MVHPYLARRRGDEPVIYAHPSLEPVLKRTLGVPLFQEQLLRMAMVVAGFHGRGSGRAAARDGLQAIGQAHAADRGAAARGHGENGITGQAADDIVLSITSFALYGFPESHAASFALIVYASAYLKAHFPAAFYTALLNNQPMGFYSPATLVKDAQRHGVRFAPIDVQISRWNCFVEDDGDDSIGVAVRAGVERSGGEADRRSGLGNWPQAAGRDLGPEALSRADLRFRSMDGSSRAPVCVRTKCARSRKSARSRRSAATAGRRCGRPERAGRPAGPLLVDDDDQARRYAWA